MRTVTICLLTLFAALLTLPAAGSSLERETAATLRKAAADLDEVERSESAKLAEKEIALAREWLEKGTKLLRARKARKAAVYAQRLPSQLMAIRAVIAAGEAILEAEALEAKVLELEGRLARAKERLDRLVISRDGADASLAYPRREGGTDGR